MYVYTYLGTDIVLGSSKYSAITSPPAFTGVTLYLFTRITIDSTRGLSSAHGCFYSTKFSVKRSTFQLF